MFLFSEDIILKEFLIFVINRVFVEILGRSSVDILNIDVIPAALLRALRKVIALGDILISASICLHFSLFNHKTPGRLCLHDHLCEYRIAFCLQLLDINHTP